MVKTCRQCGRVCKNAHGLAIHAGRMHSNRVPLVVEPIPPEPEPPDPDAGSVESQSSSDEELQCQVCNQSFDTQRGFLTHRATHAEVANNARLGEQHLPEQVEEEEDEDGEEFSLDQQLVAECTKLYAEFTTISANLHQFDPLRFHAAFEDFAKFLFRANQELPGPLHPAVKMHRLRRQGKTRVKKIMH